MKKRNISLYIISLISLIAVLFTIFQRMEVEGENKTVEITLDYREMEDLARQSGKDLKWWFEEFKKLGVASVAIEEETLESLVEERKGLEVYVLEKLFRDIDWKERYDSEFVKYVEESCDDYDVVAITKSKEIYDFIINGLQERYPKDFYKGINGSKYFYTIIDGDELDLLYTSTEKIINFEGKAILEKKDLYSSAIARIGLGFDENKINLIRDSGLDVVLRPINFNKHSENLPDAFIKELQRHDIKPAYIIFSGKEVLGYPNGLEKMKDYMKSNNISIGMIETSVQREHLEQEGLEEVVEAVDYRGIRVFSVWPYIQERYKYYNYEGAEEIENTFYRAVTERNIRIIYFKPFKEKTYKYVTDIDEYRKTFRSFEKRIGEHGMTLGKASTMKPYNIGTLRQSIIGFALVAIGVIILNILLPLNNIIKYGLTIIGMLFVLSINYLIPGLAEKFLALSASILFPTLGITYFIEYAREKAIKPSKSPFRQIVRDPLCALLLCVGISLIGGLFIGAILSSTKYLLEMDIFRGVKVSQLIPILLYCIIYIFKFGFGRSLEDLSREDNKREDFLKLLNYGIKVKHIVALGVVAVFGYIYISRTGHETNVQPSDIEMIARNFLENVLIARPRTKEFLIAFPALMLSVYLANRGYRNIVFPLGLGAVIGLTSIANTFSHLRTPIYLSLVRTLYSVILGALIGIMAILFVRFLEGVVISSERSKG